MAKWWDMYGGPLEALYSLLVGPLVAWLGRVDPIFKPPKEREPCSFRTRLVVIYQIKSTQFSSDKCGGIVWQHFLSATYLWKKRGWSSTFSLIRRNAERTTFHVKPVSSIDMKCRTPLLIVFPLPLLANVPLWLICAIERFCAPRISIVSGEINFAFLSFL